MFNPYEILGLDENSSDEEIKKKYKQLVQKYHPDKVNNASDEIKEASRQMFEQVRKAYEILGDPGKRKLYDDTGYIEPELNEITRSVFSILRPLLLSYLSRGDEIFTIDIIKEIDKHCAIKIATARSNIENYKNKKGYLLKVIKKFKKKKKLKKDFITEILIQELNALDNAINGQINLILIMSQVKSIINGYEFDFMYSIDAPPEFHKPQNRVSLGNIFDLAAGS